MTPSIIISDFFRKFETNTKITNTCSIMSKGTLWTYDLQEHLLSHLFWEVSLLNLSGFAMKESGIIYVMSNIVNEQRVNIVFSNTRLMFFENNFY